MSVKHTGKALRERQSTNWDRVQTLSDTEVLKRRRADPDAVTTDAAFWKKARIVLPQPKQTVTIRLDADLLAWLRSQKGYQTRVNAALRGWMEASLR